MRCCSDERQYAIHWRIELRPFLCSIGTDTVLLGQNLYAEVGAYIR